MNFQNIPTMMMNQLFVWVNSVVAMEIVIVIAGLFALEYLITQAIFRYVYHTGNYHHIPFLRQIVSVHLNPQHELAQKIIQNSKAIAPSLKKTDSTSNEKFRGLPFFWRVEAINLLVIVGASVNILIPIPQIISPQLPAPQPIDVSQQNPLTVEFDRPFRTDKIQLEISPAISGQWVFKNRKMFLAKNFSDSVQFIPSQTMKQNQEYTVNIQNLQPLLFTSSIDMLFLFQTPYNQQRDNLEASQKSLPKVENAGFPVGPQPPDLPYPVTAEPHNQDTQTATSQPIIIEFNQLIDTQTFPDHFVIKPSTVGDYTWEETEYDQHRVSRMIFKPRDNWLYETDYLVAITRNYSDAHGNMADKDFVLQFRTLPQEFALDVPWIRQEHTFTCYVGASRMALAYYGIELTEKQAVDKIAHQDVSRSFVTGTWGDPNKGIVGSIDGSGQGGYGAHWDPVAKMISQYRPVEVKRHWNIPELLEQVKQGYPVIIWWVNGVWPVKDISWKTPDGQTVYTVNGMHVEVVNGWIGDQANPDYILTKDPWRGDRRYDQKTFKNLWKWFDNTGVIVK